MSSLQNRKRKLRLTMLLKGEKVLLQKEDGTMESRTYKAGQGWCVPLKTKHRVIMSNRLYCLRMFNFSHLNDCIRFEDDSDRGSGKIESEHEGN